MGLRLYNTLTRTKEDFVPIDPSNVRMYVCGPTVYDFAHIGNARPLIVFDVLYRLLRHLYPGAGTAPDGSCVTYVRNITDVDDKINARALRDFGAEIAAGTLSLNDAIRRVTETTAEQFHADVKALGCLDPTVEPRATDFVVPRADGRADMVTLIEKLIARGHAYVAGGEVLFDISSMTDYGKLSHRNLDEQQAGARVEVDAHKKNPGDFVLWKLSSADEPGWESPWGRGRPGWHIECSAMSAAYLGEVFDIHGGGLDLIFPHHENEIAQSRCAHGTATMANYWLHNGFLQVEGEKMSKSLGNFVTIRELLKTRRFGGRKWSGDAIRLALLMTNYREPLDFSLSRLEEASFLVARFRDVADLRAARRVEPTLDAELMGRLLEDLDTGGVIATLSSVCKKDSLDGRETYTVYKYAKTILGLKFPKSKIDRIAQRASSLLNDLERLDASQLEDISKLSTRNPLYKSGRPRPEYVLFGALKSIAALSRRFLDSQDIGAIERRLRNALSHSGEPTPGSVRLLSFIEFLGKQKATKANVASLISARAAARKAKDFAEADRIRAELDAMGIALKDAKDPATGELVTTWEVKR